MMIRTAAYGDVDAMVSTSGGLVMPDAEESPSRTHRSLVQLNVLGALCVAPKDAKEPTALFSG